MKYAIEILKIELYGLKKALNTIDKYSVHPEYTPCSNGMGGKVAELEIAIQILKNNQ